MTGIARDCGQRSLADLRREINARGWNHKATAQIVCHLLLGFAVAMGGIWLFVVSDAVWARVCAMLLSTAGSISVATNTHTSSHYATSRKRWVNELLTFLGYPVFLGLSACHWWHQHVVLHHPAPNVIGTDNDADLGPWFARTREEVERSSGMLRLYYEKVQWLVFPLAVAFIGFNMQKAGWTSLIRSLRGPGTRRTQWIDLGAMLSHYVIWLALPMAYFAPAHVIEFYVLRIGLMGYAMFAVLAPGHFPEEAACLGDVGNSADYELLQTAATINFRTGLVGRLLCSGLEYQIEHHLFPNISYVYHPKMAPLVRDFCHRRSLPYRSYSWPVAMWKSLRMLQSPPAVKADLEAFRESRMANHLGDEVMKVFRVP